MNFLHYKKKKVTFRDQCWVQNLPRLGPEGEVGEVGVTGQRRWKLEPSWIHSHVHTVVNILTNAHTHWQTGAEQAKEDRLSSFCHIDPQPSVSSAQAGFCFMSQRCVSWKQRRRRWNGCLFSIHVSATNCNQKGCLVLTNPAFVAHLHKRKKIYFCRDI